jgi:hypothetical protein
MNGTLVDLQNDVNSRVKATGGKTRYYDVELRANLLSGTWQPVSDSTNMPRNGIIISCTNATPDQAKFYRAKVRLQ